MKSKTDVDYFLKLAFTGLLLAYTVSRLLLLFRRYFDTDELEHLHAAWCISHGQVMYKDFFEHHGPLEAFLLTPFTYFIQDPIRAIWAGRLSSIAMWGGIVALQWALAKDWSWRTRAISLILLMSFTTFARKSLEIRPDLTATCLFMGVLVLRNGAPGKNRSFWMGLLLGLSFFFSPKVVFPAAGFSAGYIVYVWTQSHSWTAVWKTVLAPVLWGFAIPTLSILMYVSLTGAGPSFYRCFYLFNAHFSFSFPMKPLLYISCMQNMGLWLFAGVGLILARKDYLLGLTALTAFLGLALNPTPYTQYYLFLAPFLSYYAAVTWNSIFTLTRMKRWTVGLVASLFIASLYFPFSIQAQGFHLSNDHQISAIRDVMDHTNPSDRVFDTWSGAAFYRPHAYYFFCLVDEVKAMIRPETLSRGIIQSLEAPPCKALIWDDYFSRLPSDVIAYAKSHYHPEGEGTLYLRN